MTPYHTTILKLSNTSQEEGDPSHEEGFTVIAETEFNYNENESEESPDEEIQYNPGVHLQIDC